MKRLIIFLAFTISFSSLAQQGINYKALIKDGSGNVVANQSITVQFSILEGVANTNVYQETYTPTTDANGFVILNIGESLVHSGTYATIDWGADTHFLNVQINTGAGLVDMGTTEFKAVPYALYAKTAETITGTVNYQIGDFAQDGIVFWLDETGEHGLVCAKSDQDGGSGKRWYAGTYTYTMAKGDGLYAGELNTAIIIANQGNGGSTYAALICNELQIIENGNTYGDWYLPSKYELNIMYQNKTIIDATATANGGVAFATGGYWSSTEYLDTTAWEQDFSNGSQIHYIKSLTYRLRAVRAF